MTKILVIDDEQIIRERLKKLLELDGYEAHIAENGPKGLEIFKVQKPEIVLVDIKMPGMDGIEVLNEIKKIQNQTEVIIITGHGGIETAIEALRKGAFDYITKPIEYDELEIDIKKALEKQEMQKKLNEYVQHLEEMVEERTRNLRETQDQLIQSAKMAVVGQLAAGIGHEINNPLNRITMNIQMMMDNQRLDEKTRKKIEIVDKSADRIAGIVKSLLSFSRKEGKENLSSVSINVLIEETLKLMEHQMMLSNIEVIKEFDPALPEIKAIPNQMEEVFLNLLNNAFHAMPEGGKLRIVTSRGVWTEDDEKKHPRKRMDDGGAIPVGKEIIGIKFSDTGSGIRAEHLSKIFTPFFTTREVGKGTGLGLYLVYTLVRNHRGEIEVESATGKGTTFTITLPTERR